MHPDRSLALGLLAFSAGYLAAASAIASPEGGYATVGPRVFPLAIGVGLAGVGLRIGLRPDPGNAAVTVVLGGILLERGDTAEGRRMLESVDADRITDPAVLVNLGIEILNQGAAAEALPWFDRAVARFPDYPDAYYFRGVSHLQLGDTTAAATDLERFVSLAPDAPEAAAARGILEKLP